MAMSRNLCSSLFNWITCDCIGGGCVLECGHNQIGSNVCANRVATTLEWMLGECTACLSWYYFISSTTCTQFAKCIWLTIFIERIHNGNDFNGRHRMNAEKYLGDVESRNKANKIIHFCFQIVLLTLAVSSHLWLTLCHLAGAVWLCGGGGLIECKTTKMYDS